MKRMTEQELSEYIQQSEQDKVNWLWISSYQKLSEEFIEKYEDKVDWDCISSSQEMN